MSTTVIFPDTVLWLCGWLRPIVAANGFAGARVSDRYKGDTAAEVWVQRDGGGQVDQVRERPRLRINCFAGGLSSSDVNNLARTVAAAVLAAPGNGPVKRARILSGPTEVPEPDRNRRLLLVELDVIGVNFTA